MDLSQRIRSVLSIDPSADALEFQNKWNNWGDLAQHVREVETLLEEAGLLQGSCVAVLLRNRPSLLSAMIALLVSHRCLLVFNPIQGKTKLGDELRLLRPAAVIAHADDWKIPSVRSAAKDVGSLGIELFDKPILQARSVPGLEAVGLQAHHPDMPGIAVQMLTSGTTGPPKRIGRSFQALEQSLVAAAKYESKASGELPTLRSGVVLVTNPLVHTSGIFRATSALYSGRRIAMLERFNLEAWRDLVVRHRPKAASLVPTTVKMLLDADLPATDLSSLRVVTCGTAPLDPEVGEAFESRYGIPVLATYGSTETGPVAGWTLRDHRTHGAAKRGSVGSANAGVELRVVDAVNGEPLPANASGLLEIKTLEIDDGRRWVRTTDLARLDEDGFLWVLGRADGAIIRGGFKLLPGEIEKVLESHPSIREAAVVGLDDERLGQVPVAAVVLEERAPPLDEASLVRFAAEHLVGYQVPTRVLVVETLPRTPSLKVSQPGIRALFGVET